MLHLFNNARSEFSPFNEPASMELNARPIRKGIQKRVLLSQAPLYLTVGVYTQKGSPPSEAGEELENFMTAVELYFALTFGSSTYATTPVFDSNGNPIGTQTYTQNVFGSSVTENYTSGPHANQTDTYNGSGVQTSNTKNYTDGSSVQTTYNSDGTSLVVSKDADGNTTYQNYDSDENQVNLPTDDDDSEDVADIGASEYGDTDLLHDLETDDADEAEDYSDGEIDDGDLLAYDDADGDENYTPNNAAQYYG